MLEVDILRRRIVQNGQANPSEQGVWMVLDDRANWNIYTCWYGGIGAPRALFPGLKPNQFTIANVLAMTGNSEFTSGSAYTVRYDFSYHNGTLPHFNLDFTLLRGRPDGPKYKELIKPAKHYLPCTGLWTPATVVAAFGVPTAGSSGPIADWWRR